MRTSRLYDLLWHEAKLASKPNDGTISLASSPLTESETERNKFAFTPAKLLYNPKSLEEHLLLLPITIINPRKDYTGPSLDTSVVNGHASPIRHSATGNGPAEPNTTSAVSGSEADLELEHKEFALTPDQLRKLYNRTILGAFYALGGIDGIEKGLRTDRPAGLIIDGRALDGGFAGSTMPYAKAKHESDAAFGSKHDTRPGSENASWRTWVKSQIKLKTGTISRSIPLVGKQNTPRSEISFAQRALNSHIDLDCSIPNSQLPDVEHVPIPVSGGRLYDWVDHHKTQTKQDEAQSCRLSRWFRYGIIGLWITVGLISVASAVHYAYNGPLSSTVATVVAGLLALDIATDQVFHLLLNVLDGLAMPVSVNHVDHKTAEYTCGSPPDKGNLGWKTHSLPATLNPYFYNMQESDRSMKEIFAALQNQLKSSINSEIEAEKSAEESNQAYVTAMDSLKKIKTRFTRNLYEETSLTASPTASQPISSSQGIQSTKWKTRRSAKSLVSSFSSSTPSTLGRVLPFAFFGSAYAQDAPTAESSWRQRALAALTEPVVALASLLIPAIVLFITGYMAHHYHKKAREGKAGIGMLIMAIILISLLKPSSTATASEKYWRLAIGLAYALFMIVYCRLIALRNKWQRGSCSIVVTLAVLMAFVPMASPSVQTWWDSLTKAHPLFALSPALPLAFTVCDLAAYVAGGMNGRGDGRSGLPPPVPGPQGS